MREINVNGLNVQYELSENNLKIYDSYRFKTKTEMNEILDEIQEIYPNEELFKTRSRKSLIREWRVHNWFFNNFLYVEHTKDVDFEYPQPFYLKIAYCIFGLFV